MNPTPTSTTDCSSAITRRARANLRAAIQDGGLSLGDLLTDPPVAIENMMLVDIVCWTRRRRQHTAGVTLIGRWALRDRINLLVTVRDSSARTRTWVAERGDYGSQIRNGCTV